MATLLYCGLCLYQSKHTQVHIHSGFKRNGLEIVRDVLTKQISLTSLNATSTSLGSMTEQPQGCKD